MDAQRSPTKDKQKHYTALVYFHGIGEQRRYEEVSFLIDALDRYEHEIEYRFENGSPLRKTIDFQFEPVRRLEQSDTERERDIVGYNRVSYNDPRTPRTEYRFYEAYYADLTANGIRPTEVLLWLLKLSFMPVRMLFAHWRDLTRLRRATLLSGWKNHSGKLGDDSAWAKFQEMLKRKKRARISIKVTIQCRGEKVGEMSGDFVALAILGA